MEIPRIIPCGRCGQALEIGYHTEIVNEDDRGQTMRITLDNNVLDAHNKICPPPERPPYDAKAEFYKMIEHGSDAPDAIQGPPGKCGACWQPYTTVQEHAPVCEFRPYRILLSEGMPPEVTEREELDW